MRIGAMLRVVYVLALFGLILCDEHSHHYNVGEEVVLWMNTVGPYHNRQETYGYFTLPFCRGPKKSIDHEHETIGEALQGTEFEYSGIGIGFKSKILIIKYMLTLVNHVKTSTCGVFVDGNVLSSLSYAIANQYWYQMYLDDLPIWGVVGELSSNGNPYIWCHKTLEISYNGDQIVQVNLVNDDLVQLKLGDQINFTHQIKWIQSDIKFEDRFNKYLDYEFFGHRIHWFSIFNSFMMVLFLVTFVIMILLRTIRRDYARYNKEDSLETGLGDEYGWKQVHGDVFRPPNNLIALCSLVGTGMHIATVTGIVLVLAFTNKLYTERASLLSTSLFVYAVCSPINGLFGGSLYSRLSGRRWIRQFLIGSIMLPVFVCSAAFLVNNVAIMYRSSRELELSSIISIVFIILFLILPLNLVGTILGRNLFGTANIPCRINPVPRPIPEKKWFMERLFLILISGILPFGSIFIELYFVFTSFWAFKVYFVFGFTLLVLLFLIAVTCSVIVVCIYFLLNSEDYRWQWTSFLSGSSIAIYAFLYSVYYFIFKTKMYGLFQTTFYFSYMTVFCTGLGIMCGSMGYLAASLFLHKIYSTVKVD